MDNAVSEGGAIELSLHAERIRWEMIPKWAQQQQTEAENAGLTTKESGIGIGVDSTASGHAAKEDALRVGNSIKEDSVNYVLMNNLLSGIRIGASRCQAKIKRPLTNKDFTFRHEFSLDLVGDELGPSVKCKFKDYAPWVFRYLREDVFDLDPADYLLSLTTKNIFFHHSAPGKLGSIFYFSANYRYIIQTTVSDFQRKYVLKNLDRYYAYMKKNPHTRLSRFYGLHRMELPRGRKIHFMIFGGELEFIIPRVIHFKPIFTMVEIMDRNSKKPGEFEQYPQKLPGVESDAARHDVPRLETTALYSNDTYAGEYPVPERYLGELTVEENDSDFPGTAEGGAHSSTIFESDDLTISEMSLASSRTESTEYGIYCRRMAVSQDTFESFVTGGYHTFL